MKRKNPHQENLLFIAQDTLNEIRENKKDQRAIFYNFIISIGIFFGLFEAIKSKTEIQIPFYVLILFPSILAIASIFLLIRLQISLSKFRGRISKIWDDKSFKFAFREKILKYESDNKSYYYSFRNGFSFTFTYIIIIIIITLLIIRLFIDLYR